MLNSRNANEELGARLTEILLRVKLCNILTQEDLAALCFATGIQIDFGTTETRLQRLQRMAREAAQVELRG